MSTGSTQRAESAVTYDAHLQRLLAPFREILADPKISEICINGSESGFWTERAGHAAMDFHPCDTVTNDSLQHIAQMLARNTGQTVREETPLLSAILPTGERVQIVLPPASPKGVALSIRKQVITELSLDEYDALGAFSDTTLLTESDAKEPDSELDSLLGRGNYKGFIARAAQKHKNIIISGGTSTGKTTMLNAVLQSIPPSERIITIEDTAELRPPQKNWLSLLASKNEQGRARVTIEDLLQASLRLRPDRILLGELRGKEAYTFLRAVNTGHPGSVTTVHADTPRSALHQIALMVQQNDINMTQEQIIEYVSSVVDIVIQLRRVDGQRKVSNIWYPQYQK